jgi:hypothetical protein
VKSRTSTVEGAERAWRQWGWPDRAGSRTVPPKVVRHCTAQGPDREHTRAGAKQPARAAAVARAQRSSPRWRWRQRFGAFGCRHRSLARRPAGARRRDPGGANQIARAAVAVRCRATRSSDQSTPCGRQSSNSCVMRRDLVPVGSIRIQTVDLFGGHLMKLQLTPHERDVSSLRRGCNPCHLLRSVDPPRLVTLA